MSTTQARSGLALLGAGLALAAVGVVGFEVGRSPSNAAVVGSLLAGATAGGILGVAAVDRERLVAAGERQRTAALALVGFGVLFAGVWPTSVGWTPVESSLTLLTGGILAAVGGQLAYGAATLALREHALSTSEVVVPLEEPTSRRALLAARALGVVLLATVVGTGLLAFRGSEPVAFAMASLLGAPLVPDLLFPARVGSPTLPGIGPRRYVVDDGLLAWHGLVSWSEFESWAPDDDGFELRTTGQFAQSETIRLPSDDDRSSAGSLLAEHLPERA